MKSLQYLFLLLIAFTGGCAPYIYEDGVLGNSDTAFEHCGAENVSTITVTDFNAPDDELTVILYTCITSADDN